MNAHVFKSHSSWDSAMNLTLSFLEEKEKRVGRVNGGWQNTI